uniref:Calponin-homology (CH) domain-containing protein n=1 Tax=Syphacia muris TaxID=451379 RepID=A0A0N5B004_9BILA
MLKTELCCRKGPGGIDVLLKAGQHERAQKNTFTKWINYQLETHSSSGQVKDLFEDLRDGVLLCHLVEVLTGEALN